MARHAIKTVVLTQQRRLSVEGYMSTKDGRFAVIRHRKGEGPWIVVHLRTGVGVGSILPPRCTSLADKLAVMQRWEAAPHLDWSAFDELPAIGPDSTDMPKIDQDKARNTVASMAELARL